LLRPAALAGRIRLYPGATVMIRTAARDIEITGVTIRKHALRVLATHSFHRQQFLARSSFP
jgi:cytochrome P450